MVTKYYLEFVHVNSEAENYDMQSKWFNTKKEATQWLFENFDFISDDISVFLMTAKTTDEDDYDIVSSTKIK